MTFVLAHEVVQAPGAVPGRTAFVAHGIFGSRRNWRGFARAFVRRFPNWRLVLVDLRNHGGSQPAPPPHTVAACAEDLAHLAEVVGQPQALIGHSFAAKVLLAPAAQSLPEVHAYWLLDGPPGAEVHWRESEVARMVDALRSLPIASRAQVGEQLAARGFSAAIAAWMAGNLLAGPDGTLHWHFDLDGVAQMLADYWPSDHWPILAAPPRGRAFHVAIGTHSDRITPSMRERLEQLAHSGAIHLHRLEAGHWLQTDDPEGLLAAMAATFAAST